MKKIKLTILIIFLLSSIISNSQVKIYKTFHDYENDISEEFEELNYTQFNSSLKLILIKNNVKTKIKCKNIWGFIYKKGLFRIDNENLPIRVISIGKLVYYENGLAHIRMLFEGSTSSYYDAFDGYSSYISKDLNSFIAPVSKGMNFVAIKRVKKRIREFKKKHPEFKEFINNLRNYRIETVRRAITEFEGS